MPARPSQADAALRDMPLDARPYAAIRRVSASMSRAFRLKAHCSMSDRTAAAQEPTGRAPDGRRAQAIGRSRAGSRRLTGRWRRSSRRKSGSVHHHHTGHSGVPQRDVFVDGAVEENVLLQHHPDLPAQPAGIELHDVDAVDHYLTGLRTVEALDELGEGGFPDPEGPTRPITSPGSIDSETLRKNVRRLGLGRLSSPRSLQQKSLDNCLVAINVVQRGV